MVLIYYSFTHQLVSFQAQWTAIGSEPSQSPLPSIRGWPVARREAPKQEPVSPRKLLLLGRIPLSQKALQRITHDQMW